MIFEILVGRNTPSIRETFAEIFGTLRQMGYVPPMPENMVFLILVQSSHDGAQLKALGLLSAAI